MHLFLILTPVGDEPSSLCAELGRWLDVAMTTTPPCPADDDRKASNNETNKNKNDCIHCDSFNGRI